MCVYKLIFKINLERFFANCKVGRKYMSVIEDVQPHHKRLIFECKSA